MQLLPCNKPSGPLESAPRTSLLVDSERERWEGFWCVADEGYYARCVRSDESEEWYRLADEVATDRSSDVRVFALRPRGATSTQRMLLLGSSDLRRPILVGTSRRNVRRHHRGGAGGSR